MGFLSHVICVVLAVITTIVIYIALTCRKKPKGDGTPGKLDKVVEKIKTSDALFRIADALAKKYTGAEIDTKGEFGLGPKKQDKVRIEPAFAEYAPRWRPAREVEVLPDDDEESPSKSFEYTPIVYKSDNSIDKKGETMCRTILESVFQVNFPTIRDRRLAFSPVTKKALEIDCYNDELRLGLEFNGYQHYDYPNIYHKTREDFEIGQWNDACKMKMLQKAGVVLIVVDGRGNYKSIAESLYKLLSGHITPDGDENVSVKCNSERFSKLISY